MDDVFKLTLQNIHKFPLLFLFHIQNLQQFIFSLRSKCAFWDQDPVCFTADVQNKSLLLRFRVCVLRNVCGQHWWLSLYLEI